MNNTVSRRLDRLRGQLSSTSGDVSEGIVALPCAGFLPCLEGFDPNVMANFVDDLIFLKKQVYDVFIKRPDLLPSCTEGLTKEQHRELVRKSLHLILESGILPMNLFDTDIKKYIYMAELAAPIDLSLTVKMGVQYSLWGGSVINLGTARHRAQFFDDINTFKSPGCFAMTELKHGSNVAMLQTQAVFDLATDEWVITTPDEGAIKWCVMRCTRIVHHMLDFR